jgi:hypothetical protein
MARVLQGTSAQVRAGAGALSSPAIDDWPLDTGGYSGQIRRMPRHGH